MLILPKFPYLLTVVPLYLCLEFIGLCSDVNVALQPDYVRFTVARHTENRSARQHRTSPSLPRRDRHLTKMALWSTRQARPQMARRSHPRPEPRGRALPNLMTEKVRKDQRQRSETVIPPLHSHLRPRFARTRTDVPSRASQEGTARAQPLSSRPPPAARSLPQPRRGRPSDTRSAGDQAAAGLASLHLRRRRRGKRSSGLRCLSSFRSCLQRRQCLTDLNG